MLRAFLLGPVALDAHRAAGVGKPDTDRADGGHGGFAGVNAAVIGLQAQLKKGEPSRACRTAPARLGVFSLVPSR